jgi:hypothetical protein
MSWERFFEVTFGVKPDAPSALATKRGQNDVGPDSRIPSSAPVDPRIDVKKTRQAAATKDRAAKS